MTMGWISPIDGDEMATLSPGDFVEYRAYTDVWESQQSAILEVKKVEDRFVSGVHWGAKDVYLEWFMSAAGEVGAIGKKVRYHFCECAAKDCLAVASPGYEALHIYFYKHLFPEEAYEVLKSWSVAVLPTLAEAEYDESGDAWNKKAKKKRKQRVVLLSLIRQRKNP